MNKGDEIWSNQFPTEAGWYWFLGQPWMGSMGEQYREDYVPKIELFPVKIQKVSNGVIGVCCGQFMYKEPFNREHKIPGYLGKFTPATLPVMPK